MTETATAPTRTDPETVERLRLLLVEILDGHPDTTPRDRCKLCGGAVGLVGGCWACRPVYVLGR